MINAYPTISQVENCLSSSTSQDAPLLSIVVPNYNHARFLPERFASILAQSIQDFELIVLDDSSTDDSVAVIRALLAEIPHKLIINQSNSGSPCSQWLRGIQEARGRYIWIAESDDSCSAEFLETMVDLLDQGASLAYCRSHAIDSHGQGIESALYWPDHFDPVQWKSGFTMASHEFCQRYLVNGNVIPNASSVLFQRKQALDCLSIKPLLNHLLFTGDWIFWSHYLANDNAHVSFSAREDSWFRHHSSSTRAKSGSHAQESHHIKEYCNAINLISDYAIFKPHLTWAARALNPGWDWIYLEYIYRCNPTRLQTLVADGLDGPVAELLPMRLLCSSELRRHLFPTLYKWTYSACHWLRTTKARVLHLARNIF
jgi:glycosyltransferase involved in cell wall biosynthesis